MGEKSLQKLRTTAVKLQTIKSKLEENSVVQKYIETINSYNTISDEIEKLEHEELLELQKNCNHEAWFLISSDQDYHSSNVDYRCRCLGCELEKYDRYKRFSFVLEIPKLSYWEASKIYRQYKKELELNNDNFDEQKFKSLVKTQKK